MAAERELIARNPMRVNSRNRKLKVSKVSKVSKSYLDSARQITAFLDAADELDREAYACRRHLARRAMFATLVFSGLRLGELVALRWRDVDLAGGWLNVRQAKTDAGVRKIKVRPALRDALAEIRPTDADPQALVFPTASGKAHSQSNVRRTKAAVLGRANDRLHGGGDAPLPRLSPHDLRRTFASVMFALGEPLPNVMADGGWSEPGTPLKVYAATMRRDESENAALRALVNGDELRIEAGKGRTDHEASVESAVARWTERDGTRS